ncbi:MAG: TetR/AcrR family transcriptional regulator [Planctomycetota bacterium]
MAVFREKGFDGTSMKDLNDAMDMGTQSIYNVFGHKEDVYLAALDRYCCEHSGAAIERLEATEATVETIKEFFDMVLKSVTSDAPT